MAYDIFTGKKISTRKSAEQLVRGATWWYMTDNEIPNPKNLDVSLDIVHSAIVKEYGDVNQFADRYAWKQTGLHWYLASRFGRIVTWYAIRKTAIILGFHGYKGLLA